MRNSTFTDSNFAHWKNFCHGHLGPWLGEIIILKLSSSMCSTFIAESSKGQKNNIFFESQWVIVISLWCCRYGLRDMIQCNRHSYHNNLNYLLCSLLQNCLKPDFPCSTMTMFTSVSWKTAQVPHDQVFSLHQGSIATRNYFSIGFLILADVCIYLQLSACVHAGKNMQVWCKKGLLMGCCQPVQTVSIVWMFDFLLEVPNFHGWKVSMWLLSFSL